MSHSQLLAAISNASSELSSMTVDGSQPARPMLSLLGGVKLKKVGEKRTEAQEIADLEAYLVGEGMAIPLNPGGLKTAKRAAGLASTTRPAADFDAFKSQLKYALQLGCPELGRDCTDVTEQSRAASRTVSEGN